MEDHLVPTPLLWAGIPFTRLLRAPSNLALNTSRTGTSTDPLDNLFQCLIILSGKEFLPTIYSKSVLQPEAICPCPGLVKGPSPAFLVVPFRYWKATVRPPWSRFLSRLNHPNPQPISQQRCSSPLIIFMASSGVTPNMSSLC